MRMRVRALALLNGLRICLCCELWCRSQMRLGSALLWLWHRPAATTPIQSLAWELPYAFGCGPEKEKKKKYIYIYIYMYEWIKGFIIVSMLKQLRCQWMEGHKIKGQSWFQSKMNTVYSILADTCIYMQRVSPATVLALREGVGGGCYTRMPNRGCEFREFTSASSHPKLLIPSPSVWLLNLIFQWVQIWIGRQRYCLLLTLNANKPLIFSHSFTIGLIWWAI